MRGHGAGAAWSNCLFQPSVFIIEACDMTLEAVVTKTMWLQGQSGGCSAFRRRCHSPVQHDVLLPE